ncbi:unnamed protein product [Thlaspi arvense]|uniref:Uncharacterized protein n=1 Tax=Thlaspi arvense TaxID=13288 RepID=A0AAU9SRA9_THLAR|nr:unnamed protein product [Thlaspi arvense]
MLSAVTDDTGDKQVYIVYMGALPSRPSYTPMSNHISILHEVTGESSIEGRLVRIYKRSFNGFAARLTESERERIAEMEEVVSVFPNKKLQLQTTASWDFLGLKEGEGTKRNPTVESDTIIGVIDSGITPESESFSGKGFGPPPKKWKGVCSGGTNFTCNNKLIGARDYTNEGTRDRQGHGTHTASTAAGNAVVNTSFFGLGNGTARGGVPGSRIAAYKACDEHGCTSEALLSAFDDAIADGVDLISVSLGGKFPLRYEADSLAIGAFHAMTKGILTVQSAGNDGPDAATVISIAPWVLTVAASITNREFVTKVVLGNGNALVGKSINVFDLKGKMYPLMYGESFNESLVKGKILVSRYKIRSKVAVATIIRDYEGYASGVTSQPMSALSQDDFDLLVSYVNSTKSPQGTVLKTEAIFDQKAPTVASFSSRGPNTMAVDLLKPDVTAPGVAILAAYSPLASPTDGGNDPRRVKYSILSGTSMACPHVAGVAAYVKTFHPDWSPSMIQSAIMSTAWPTNATGTGTASTEFAFGSGHVDPIAALNPGLVYELDKADHISFLCGLNYTSNTLKLISGEEVNCSGTTLPRNLNYPSMSAKLPGSQSSFSVTFNRTVTNLGNPNSTYISKVVLNQGPELNVTVSPSVLSMKSVNEKQSFVVTVSGSDLDPKQPSSANLIWSDGTHNKKRMAKRAVSFCLLSCVVVLCLSSVSAVTEDSQHKQVYVVYMGSLPSQLDYTPMSHHMSILQEVTGESSIEGRLVRSYKRSFNGFAARLTESERERIAEMEGVVSVFPSKKLQIQTTASWDFMGMKEGTNTKRNLAVESDTIIGLIDTGITPESESFSDKGFGPPPKKWKGVCAGGKNFTCNNKLIGARDYTKEGARDSQGHGTHTSSIAAGNAVPNTSFFVLGNGTARGGVPAARVAAYKVCDSTGCTSEAILSAFDDAIADGVDLISVSLAIDGRPASYEYDTISIGAFHAMAKGILTVSGAGNFGPTTATVTSVAPWIFTVAASTTNRAFVTKVVLGDGRRLVGKSVNSFDLKGKNYPFIYEQFYRDPSKGKILVRELAIISSVAVATIIRDSNGYAVVRPRPASALSNEDYNSLVSYVKSTKSAQGTVLRTETILNQTAPTVGYFSSRGPNIVAVDLLKPDITAPGVEILAAFSPDAEPSPSDTRRVKYSVLSGTSMACPHVAGVAAYVKTFHPDWSPSVIQSAIMTTAWPMNGTGFESAEFAYGAGHVNPIAALNPGLVYELDKADHIVFLCGLNFNVTALKLIAGEAVNCSRTTLPRNLNYPSMSAKIPVANSSFAVTFERTVTNFGTPNSTYKSKVVLNQGPELNVTVSPSVLSMKSVNEKQSFTVTVTGSNLDSEQLSSANLIWSDGTHNVRSPIVVYNQP